MRAPAVKLRTRIGLYFLVLVATWTVLVLVLLGDFLSRTSRQLLRERGADHARVVALECAPLAHYDDVASIAKVGTDRIRPPSDVRFIIVFGNGGEVVWSTFKDGVPEPLLHVPHPTRSGADVGVQLIETAEEQLYDYEVVHGGVRVRMGMSLMSVQVFAQEITTYILWTGMATLLAVFAVALHVSRPVEALMVAFARSANADGTIREHDPLYGTVETSTLADWFQHVLARLEERTRQLDRAQKLAYLGEISTSIAHEINNPLGVIVLNAGFLAKRVASGEITPPVATEVERVRSASMRATLAAQKLLEFARYSTQRSGVKRRPVQPEAFIRETVELLRDRIRLADCTVEVEVPAELPTVSLDQQGIQQVLFNFLTNAIDASPTGGKITIFAEVTGGAFVMKVSDEGRGMDDELLKHAKEPFVTTKEPGKGTGLGLAISDSIVIRHGGQLSLVSRPGQGTTATVRIPIGVSP